MLLIPFFILFQGSEDPIKVNYGELRDAHPARAVKSGHVVVNDYLCIPDQLDNFVQKDWFSLI